MVIRMKKSGLVYEIIRDGFVFCRTKDEEFAAELLRSLSELERNLDRERRKDNNT